MNLDICRKCEERHCWIYFNTDRHEVEISLSMRDYAGRNIMLRLDDEKLYEMATETIVKRGDTFVLYKETAPCSKVVEKEDDRFGRVVVSWPFGDYAPNSRWSRRCCPYYTEHVLDALSRSGDDEP